MATSYFYRLSPANTLLRVVDEFGPINTWEAVEHAEKLVVTPGIVSTTADGHILHSGPVDNAPIVTLFGASWNSVDGGRTRIQLAYPRKCGDPPTNPIPPSEPAVHC